MSENHSSNRLSWLLLLLTSGKASTVAQMRDETIDRTLRFIAVNLLGFISSLLILTIGTIEVHGGNLNLGLMMWAIGFLIFTHLFLLRTELPYEVGAIVIVVLYGVFCSLQTFPQFNFNSDAIIVGRWFFTFPAVAVFTLGTRISCPLVLIVLFVNLCGIVEQTEFWSDAGFFGVNANVTRTAMIYLLMYLLLLAYEYLRDFKDRLMRSINKKLEDERKIAEELRENAEQASRVKSEFISRTTHELRTPLNAILGMTTIAQSAPTAEKIHYCLSQINNAGTHLLGIINDVLDIAKIEADKFELSMTDFELVKLLTRVTDIIRFNAEKKHLDLKLNFAENLPTRIHSDEQRLAQVFTNLLGNAIKFTAEHGKVALAAEKISEASDTVVLRFTVSDTGIGITPAQQKKLFQPFQQADGSTSRKFGGTGLGLTISKRIIEEMGGEIFIESESGKGAAFIFTIQANLPTATNAAHYGGGESVNPLENAETAEYDFRNRHVLLVDDVDINREIALTFLEGTNLEIDEATNGQEAYDRFAAHPEKYDLILMDIQMPGVDGYDATRMIRRHPLGANIPIIAMTANIFREDIDRCHASGMNHHIGKPIDIDSLLRTLKNFLPHENVNSPQD